MLFKKLEVRFLCTPSLTYTGQWCNAPGHWCNKVINPLQLVNWNVFTMGSNKSDLGNFILSIIIGFVLSFKNCVSSKEFEISNSARANESEYI